MSDSPKNLDTRPVRIKENEVGVGKLIFGTQKVLYTVLKKELALELPWFLGYPEGEHLFISEEVPEVFVRPQLIHEVVEFTQLKGEPWRCLLALQIELANVPDEFKKEYIPYRKNFFANLIKYYETSWDEEFKDEIKASYEFLETLV